jgi:Fur family peroxide stress response transcriptional regulator
MKERSETLIARLKETGYRLTPQRVAVLKVLAESDRHLSVEEIHEAVRVDFPMTSLATVYKTLATLKEIGEVSEVMMKDGSSRIDGQSGAPHPHLICMTCGEILDADLAGQDDLIGQLVSSHQYEIKGYRLDFFGFCPDCQAEEAPVKIKSS